MYAEVNFGSKVREGDGQIPDLRGAGRTIFWRATVSETMTVIARYLVHDAFLTPHALPTLSLQLDQTHSLRIHGSIERHPAL